MVVFMFVVEILIMIGLPVTLWFVLKRYRGVTWGIIGAGVASFVLSQVVHIPLNYALGLLDAGRVAQWPVLQVAVVAGLSAGVCEELARYVMLRFVSRDARSWRQGLAFGAGHGGIESILLGLAVLSSLASMIYLREMDLATLGLSGDMLEQAQAQVDAFWSLAWYEPLWGALERASAIVIQLALTLLVLQVFTRRKMWWLGIAILAHALVDGVVVAVAMFGWPVWAIEVVALGFALAGGVIIYVLRSSQPEAPVQDSSCEVSASSNQDK